MPSFTLNRSLPLQDSWDVIVVGGGPAGCTAAASAAREGARTLLIEATGALGGMGTSGLVPAWCPFSDQEKIIYRGLAERVFREAKAGVPHVPAERLDWVPIQAEQLKRVYDNLLAEMGVTVLFHTMLAAVEAEGGTVRTVIVSNKAGLSAYRAAMYVDATGDGDLAAWVGAKFQQGETGPADVQPASHCFVLANVDDYAYYHGFSKETFARSVFAGGRYPLIADRHMCFSQIGSRVYGCNAGHLWNVDGTDPGSLSKAMTLGRQVALQFLDALREFCPAAFGGAVLVATAPLMGIRESRRIVGDYVLTRDDFLALRSFEDEICRNCYFIDVHHTLQESQLDRAGNFDLSQKHIHLKPGQSHGVPYRCLTPKGLANVLVAGRSISCDRAVQGSVRVMPVCLAMGEAAGLAAALALRGNADVHHVDTADLRSRLRAYGAYLP